MTGQWDRPRHKNRDETDDEQIEEREEMRVNVTVPPDLAHWIRMATPDVSNAERVRLLLWFSRQYISQADTEDLQWAFGPPEEQND